MTLASLPLAGSGQHRAAPRGALEGVARAVPDPVARGVRTAVPPARVLRGAARCASHVAGRNPGIARRRAGRSAGRHD
jgi:hypothetical protein